MTGKATTKMIQNIPGYKPQGGKFRQSGPTPMYPYSGLDTRRPPLFQQLTFTLTAEQFVAEIERRKTRVEEYRSKMREEFTEAENREMYESFCLQMKAQGEPAPDFEEMMELTERGNKSECRQVDEEIKFLGVLIAWAKRYGGDQPVTLSFDDMQYLESHPLEGGRQVTTFASAL